MSPQAGFVLMREIVPRLRSAIPTVVHPLSGEDREELIQDAIATAANMLDRVERAGKRVTPGNIAYYAILHMKSGRRSQCQSRADAMAPGTQMDRKSSVLSLEEEVGYDPEIDEPIRLGELLSCSRDDPAMTAGRNLDWEEFLRSHDYRYGVMVRGIAEGQTRMQMARKCRMKYHRMTELNIQMVSDLIDFMEDPIQDAMQVPSWRGNLLVEREKAACRAERRRGWRNNNVQRRGAVS